jgi:hypothetical protein
MATVGYPVFTEADWLRLAIPSERRAAENARLRRPLPRKACCSVTCRRRSHVSTIAHDRSRH